MMKEYMLRLSYSRVSKFASLGAKELNDDTKTIIDNDGTSFGKIVDILEQNIDINNGYIIFDEDKPTSSLGILCDYIIDNFEKEMLNEDEIINIINDLNLWSNIKKREVLVSKFDTNQFWKYIGTKLKAKKENKKVISTSEYSDALEVVSTLRNHKFTKHIFNNKDENKEIINQYELKFKYKGSEFLGYVDKIIIDHKNKTIQLIDLKTGEESSYKFLSAFLKWKYYLQEAIYSIGAKVLLTKYKKYKILPFTFVYISKFENIPLVYEVDEKWHNASLNGFIKNGFKYKGLDELIDDIEWHIDNQEFSLSREVIENNGKLILNSNIIKLENEV